MKNTKMSTIEGIFSLRLVVADFYLDKPVSGLDPTYSEFRGKEIKRVGLNNYEFVQIITYLIKGAHHKSVWCQFQWTKDLHAHSWSVSLLLHTL